VDERRDNIEVRLHKDGTLDEIVIYDPHTDQCIFHMEQMDDHYYWMRAYGITQDLVVHVGATIGMCDGEPILDEKNFVKGYKQVEGPKVWANYDWDDSVIQSEEFRTPEAERRAEIAQLINKYGVACVLQDIAEIHRQGRKAEHERVLIDDLESARTKFLAGDSAYWDARIAENYGQDP
jgi:hypothetical protein